MMPKSEAQSRATKKYNNKAYDSLAIRIPKGERDLFNEYAKQAGLSLAQFIRQACYEKAGEKMKF